MHQPRYQPLALSLAPALALAAACGDPGPEPVAVENLAAVENPANVLSYHVEWETDVRAAGDLEVTCGDAYRAAFETPPGTRHEVFVMGLVAGTECRLSVTARADSGAVGSATTTAAVGPLPDSLPELGVETLARDRVQPGWTLFNLSNYADQVPLTIVLVDADGRYRWYHQRATTRPGSDVDTRLVSEGVLVGGLRGLILPAIIGWEGEVAWEENFAMHHDIGPDGDESAFLFLQRKRVARWNRDTGEIDWSWAIADHYTPPDDDPDWAHLNTIERFPGENALLASSRNQNKLFKVDRDTGDIVWALGRGGDFDLAPGDVFLHQHDPEILENGNIVLFDNGLAGEREYSRAIEIAYDEETMTAEVVWSFRPDPDIWAPIWSDADRLQNGNTLVTFGRRDAELDVGTNFIEVSAGGEVLWHLTTPPVWGVYRGERVEPRYGYAVAR